MVIALAQFGQMQKSPYISHPSFLKLFFMAKSRDFLPDHPAACSSLKKQSQTI